MKYLLSLLLFAFSASAAVVNTDRFQVNAVDFGAVPGDAADDYKGLTNAYARAKARGVELFLPAGEYNISKSLTWDGSVIVRGMGESTVLKPTAAVTGNFITINGVLDAALGNLSKRTLISNLRIDGTNTTGAIGLRLGNSALNTDIELENVTVMWFRGSGAEGISLGNTVHTRFVNVKSTHNQRNFVTNPSEADFPTTTTFINCKFREAVGDGAVITEGADFEFYACTWEANGGHGLLVEPGANKTAINITLFGGWFEANHLSLATALRTNEFSFVVDGRASGSGAQASVYGTRFTVNGSTSEKTLAFYSNTKFVVSDIQSFAQDGHCLIDANSRGNIVNWDENNSGSVFTTISNLSANVFYDQGYSRITDYTGAAMTAASKNTSLRFQSQTFGHAEIIVENLVTNNHATFGDVLTTTFYPANAGLVLPGYMYPYFNLGNVKTPPVMVGAGATLAATNRLTVITNSGALFFPSAAVAGNGNTQTIKTLSGVTVTNTPDAAQTFDASATDVLGPFESATYVSDGTNKWYILR